ncbi:hypothetical protein WJX72_000885 [[Myrmecia] bisecta]|uniref:Flavin-containing monooxygenase n=1 Tax=[Myrmecia] bisecta TaxID=41462 RepID=A0AAW1PZN4_9CHLO
MVHDTRSPEAKLAVAVIGCGAAGLVTARELLREGLNVTVYEQSSHLGGVWKYEEEVEDDLRNPSKRVHSSMYQDLRTNLPRQLMSFSDFPLTVECLGPKSLDPRRYCSHQEVLRFLERFADEYQLWEHIRFNAKVVSIRPIASDSPASPHMSARACMAPGWGWAVATQSTEPGSTSSDSVVAEFDAVVSCIGNYSEPNLPDVDGMEAFPGRQLHCHNYRRPDAFAGQTVLVVGASFSGEEIARRIAAVARHVFHAARSWPAPPGVQPAPCAGVTRLSMLQRLTSRGEAFFQGGECVQGIESIVYATGYKYSYPFLDELDLISTVAPSLGFIGLLWKSVRNMQFELQAKYVARVLSGRVVLPSRASMEADIQTFQDLLERAGVPVRYTHNQSDAMPVDQWAYNDWLAEACGEDVPRPAGWRRRMHTLLSSLIFGRPDSFRDQALPGEEELYAEADAACARMWQQHQEHKRDITQNSGLAACRD